MVKGKKEKGVKYNLIYRSSTDAAHADEENPSDLVLVAATNANHDRKERLANYTGRVTRKDRILNKQGLEVGGDTVNLFASATTSRKDHVNELGLPNDGYDYTQHMKAMGGGRFIGADGKERVLAYTQNKENPFEASEAPTSSGGTGLDLPEDVLPSSGKVRA